MEYKMYCIHHDTLEVLSPFFLGGMILRFDWLCEGLDLWWLSKATRRFNDFFVRGNQAQIVSFRLSPMRKNQPMPCCQGAFLTTGGFTTLPEHSSWRGSLVDNWKVLVVQKLLRRDSLTKVVMSFIWFSCRQLTLKSLESIGSNFSTGPNPSEWWKYRNFVFLLSSGHKERCGHARTRGQKLWWFFVHWKCGNPNWGNHFCWGIQIHWEFRHTRKNEKEPREKWCLPVICYASCSQFFILRGKPAIHWTLAAVGSVQRFRSNSSE